MIFHRLFTFNRRERQMKAIELQERLNKSIQILQHAQRLGGRDE